MIEIIILPDGKALVPVEADWMAEALGDSSSAERCRQSMRTRVIEGERRCG